MDSKRVNTAKRGEAIPQPSSEPQSQKDGNVKAFPYSVQDAGIHGAKERSQPKLQSHGEDPILVVSLDQAHSDVRRKILEQAGFNVVAVTDLRSLGEACKTQAFSLVIIGFSIPPAEKARIAHEMKDCHKDIPTLELHDGRDPDIAGTAFSFLQSATSEPDAFLETVRSIRGGYYQALQPTGT
ncbi:MAG: hypothetical protein ABIP12_07075 [Terriglobales bacterium]